MQRRVYLNYSDLLKVIKTYATWTYTGNGCSVVDEDKNIYIKVIKNTIEFAVKSSSVFIKQMINTMTEGVEDEQWVFFLKFIDLLNIVQTYEKLSCTYIDKVSIEEDGSNIKMVLYEKSKEGFPSEYNQEQKYLYPKTTFCNADVIFKPLDIPTQTSVLDMRNLSILTETMVPKLLESRDGNAKMQFEEQSVFVKDSNCIYSYVNKCPNIFYNGLAIGKHGASVLRSLAKYAKNDNNVSAGCTANHLVIFLENMVIYITKGSLTNELHGIINIKKPEWTVVMNQGYFKDVLKRYDKVGVDIPTTFYKDTNRMYMKAGGITQHVHTLEMSDSADKVLIHLPTKLIQKMLLKNDNLVRLRVVEKKGRKKSSFYLGYLDGGVGSEWVSVLHIKRG